MFEKEAEEYAEGMAKYYESAHSSIPSQFEKYLRKAVVYGYNKANEWHYPSKGEYPKDEKNFQSYVVAFYGAKGSFANGKPCWKELCYDTETKRWVDRDTLGDLPYVNKKGIVIAWKEIVLPELKESKYV